MEILLNATSTKHTLAEVAARSGWSIPKVSNVMKALDRAGWTERHGPQRGAGVSRTVTKPGSMLDAWTQHLGANRPVRRLGHRLMRDPAAALTTEIAPLFGDQATWAVTGWVGLALTAPFLTQTPAIFTTGKIREVDTGANFELWRRNGPLVTRAVEKGVPVINAVRLYADLMALGGRGEDAARHLRETVIGY